VSKQATPPPLGDKPAPSAPPSPPRWRHWLWPIALIAFLALWLLLPTLHTNQVTLSYSQFLSKVGAQQIKTVTLGSNGEASGTLKNGTTYNTVIPSQAGQALLDDLQNANVEITASAPGPSFGSEVLTWILLLSPFLLIGWLWTRLSRGAGGQLQGVLGVGRSRAKVFDAERPQTRFADVAGYEGAKQEIAEVVDFLRNPDRYRRAGATPPRGVLMVGPPGTGKTLLARAVAGEAEVPFFSVAGSSFVELFVGVGAARVRDLFAEARKRAPAIIFIDEIDAIGQRRAGAGAVVANDEREQTLQQILTEMDGFSGREGIIVLAATNQPDVLDRALLRPGRFDRRVVVNLPDKAGREAILRVHVRKVPLDADVNLEELAQATPGFSGADLKNLVNETALLAARRSEDAVHHKDFLDALEKIVLGPERPLLLGPEDRERIASHESGHAILGLLVPGADPVHRVSIVPRGQALGVTYQRPQTDRYNYPEAYLRARIIGMLGGRAAEEVVYGTRTTGAENDIEQATQLARNMVTRWGMSDAVGMVQLAPAHNPYLGGPAGFMGEKPFSEDTGNLIDAEVQRIINECHEEAKRLLREHRAALDALVAALLKQETVSEQEILQATGLPPAPLLEGRPMRG